MLGGFGSVECDPGNARSAGAWGMLILGAFLGSWVSPVLLQGFALPIFRFSACLGWFLLCLAFVGGDVKW